MYCLEDEKLLTQRELEVLECLHDGLTNPKIAERLCITVYTVKAHLSKIFRKLGAKNRMDVLLILVGEKEISRIEIRKQLLAMNKKAFSKIK